MTAPVLTVDSNNPSVYNPGQYTIKLTVHSGDAGAPGKAEFDCGTADLVYYGTGTKWKLTPAN